MGGTYRQDGDYLIPNLVLLDADEYRIGKYGRMRRSYLKAADQMEWVRRCNCMQFFHKQILWLV